MKSNSATASKLYLDILLQALIRHDVDKQDFLNCCERDTRKFDDNSRRLPVDDALYYWSKAAEITQCKTLGLEAGRHVHPSDYGIMSHVWMNCENLLEGAQLTVNYKHLMNSAFQTSVKSTGDGHKAYSLKFPGIEPQSCSAFIELDFASILYLGRFLCDRIYRDKVALETVHFRHCPNTDISSYEDIFGCPVKFEQSQNFIICKDETLNLPVHAPNKLLRNSMIKMVDRVVSMELGGERITGRVLSYIEKHLNQGLLPEAEAAAKHFGFSLSTFKRNLQSEQTSYLELCHQVRKKIAAKMLRQADISIGEITFSLGFANASAFHRAFKRWFDETPKQYRQNYLASKKH